MCLSDFFKMKLAIEDIHVIGPSSCELNENRFTGSHNVLKGVQDLSHIPSTYFVRFEVKLATGDVQGCVTVSFMKIGLVKAVLY